MLKNPDIHGLILTGGFSQRMGKDKSMLNYHGSPQFRYLYNLLSSFCENVFLSCRKDQSGQFGDQFQMIFDLHHVIGPMNGLLSFFDKFPSKACLIVACDMPFIDADVIEFLIKNRRTDKLATAYLNKKGFPEPLLTIWEPTSYRFLEKAFQKMQYSLVDILEENDCHYIKTNDEKYLLNINRPEELEAILNTLKLPPEKL